jgi:hypothetical protein
MKREKRKGKGKGQRVFSFCLFGIFLGRGRWEEKEIEDLRVVGGVLYPSNPFFNAFQLGNLIGGNTNFYELYL